MEPIQQIDLAGPGRRRHGWRRIAALALGALLLALLFMAYLRPAFMLELANRIMLC